MNEAMTTLPRIVWYLANAQRRLYWNRQKFKRYQEKHLRSVVRYAYNFVPFYRQKLRSIGISPGDIVSLEDLSKLPIVRKEEIKREDPRRLVSSEYDLARLKVVKTSGSTGQPLQIFLNRAEDDWRKAIYMRANISCGQRARDHWVVLTSPYHFSDTTGLQRKLGVYAQTCVSVFAPVSEQLMAVEKARADVLDGYSGSISMLAREVQRRGLTSIKPRIIFGTAELIDKNSIQSIERVFGAPYYDQFGCAELDRTGWMCPRKVGYHMDADSVITEFVDEKGENVSFGERGEVVYTSLFNYSMPLIRYAVGDVGIPSEETCSCGRRLPLMKVAEGRKTAFLLLPDGQLIHPLSLNQIMVMFELSGQIEKFRIVQKKLDLFKISIELREKNIDENVFKTKLVKHIVNTLASRALREEHFDVEFVEKIAIDKSGKYQTISSEVTGR